MKYKYLLPNEVDDMLQKICDIFQITLEDLKGTSRINEFTEPRSICYYIIHRLHDFSAATLARKMNKRRCNVIIISKNVKESIKVDKRYKAKIDNVLKLIKT